MENSLTSQNTNPESGHVEVDQSQKEIIGSEACNGQIEVADQTEAVDNNTMETSEYGWFDAVFVLGSMVLFMVDQILDIKLAVEYYQQKEYWYFGLTLAFVLIPALTMTFFSLRWYFIDEKNNKKPHVGCLHRYCRLICHLLQIAPMVRYMESLYYGIRSRRSGSRAYFQLKIFEEEDASMLCLFGCFMESSPQLVLQIYILLQEAVLPNSIDQPIKIFFSLSSVAWGMAAYNRNLRKSLSPKKQPMTWLGTAFHFLWQFFTIGSRVLALAFFISLYPYWFCLFCAAHWILMTYWICWQNTNYCNHRWEEACYNIVMGIVYIFCFFNVKDEETRRKYLIYYLVLLLEGTALMVAWYLNFDPTTWYHSLALIAFYFMFFSGIIFMVVYYYCLHPSKGIHPNYSLRLSSCLRDDNSREAPTIQS